MFKTNEFLSAPEYAFFRENPDVANVAYLVVSGSRGYGTNTPASDIDLRGFVVEPKYRLLGSTPFDQFEDRVTDTVLYGVKKFFTLCRATNPGALELLGADDENVVAMTEAGREVRDNADLFLSKRVIQAFGGYASNQLRRLSNALCHDQFDENKQECHLRDTLNGQMDHFNRTYAHFDRNTIKISADEVSGVCVDITLRDYPLREFTGILSEMREVVKTYDKLNARNRKKDDAHLFKHAMHLLRLLITGADILNGKGIVTKRRAEHGFLMDIRNGVYPFGEIFKLAEDYRAKFDAPAVVTTLPDEGKIEALQIKLLENSLT